MVHTVARNAIIGEKSGMTIGVMGVRVKGGIRRRTSVNAPAKEARQREQDDVEAVMGVHLLPDRAVVPKDYAGNDERKRKAELPACEPYEHAVWLLAQGGQQSRAAQQPQRAQHGQAQRHERIVRQHIVPQLPVGQRRDADHCAREHCERRPVHTVSDCNDDHGRRGGEQPVLKGKVDRRGVRPERAGEASHHERHGEGLDDDKHACGRRKLWSAQGVEATDRVAAGKEEDKRRECLRDERGRIVHIPRQRGPRRSVDGERAQ
eukprot:6772384-Prymnesium_polylepis.1